MRRLPISTITSIILFIYLFIIDISFTEETSIASAEQTLSTQITFDHRSSQNVGTSFSTFLLKKLKRSKRSDSSSSTTLFPNHNPFPPSGFGPAFFNPDMFGDQETDRNNALRTFLVSPSVSGNRSGRNAIQLAGSYLPFMGRVRIGVSDYHWGTICGDGWDSKDATVVCRQLGYQVGAVLARPRMEFGRRIGPIVMSQVRCEGHEKSLNDCPALRWDEGNPLECPNRLSAAGVVCNCPNDVADNVISRCYLFTNFPYDRYYCRYSCAEGSVLVGDRLRYCENQQQWTGIKPKCLKISPQRVRPTCQVSSDERVPCTLHRHPPRNLGRLLRRGNVSETEFCLSYGCCYNASAPTSSMRCYLPADSPCAHRPCLHGGNCRDRYGEPNQYECDCPSLFEGKNCEILRNWTCGVPTIPPDLRPVRPMLRIVGGKEGRRGSWPWVVQIRDKGKQFCSGTLLSPRWIITAAHCLLLKNIRNGPMNSTRWSVVAGQHLRLGRNRGSQESYVEYVLASLFSRLDIPRKDIALIKLRDSILINTFSSPICLPSSINENPAPNSKCWVAGWGSVSNSSEQFALTLQQGDIPILSNARCRQLNEPEKDYSMVAENMICAGYQQGRIDACKGDSGGPLMCPREDGSWYVAGITSWGYGCAEPNTPGVYTRVSHYLEWISDAMQRL